VDSTTPRGSHLFLGIEAFEDDNHVAILNLFEVVKKVTKIRYQRKLYQVWQRQKKENEKLRAKLNEIQNQSCTFTDI